MSRYEAGLSAFATLTNIARAASRGRAKRASRPKTGQSRNGAGLPCYEAVARTRRAQRRLAWE
jgi:hypothetical protein